MISKIAQKIMDETPLDEQIFVRQYTNIIVRIYELLESKGLTQQELAK
ncbi:hypothetical protein GCM10027566_10280 [Arachidicoccus ginsenosidivorans]|jgi:hypothetical protein|nr:hypothetical protein [Arachidicoccus ginsenosidivorans]